MRAYHAVCRFLDVEVPNIPFPRKNDKASMTREVMVFLSKHSAPVVLAVVAMGCAAWLGARVWRPRA